MTKPQEIRPRVAARHCRLGLGTPWFLGRWLLGIGCSLLLALVLGCRPQKPNAGQEADDARALFEQTSKNLLTPAAEATGAERVRLQAQAKANLEQLLKKHPLQTNWAAQALRTLGQIHAAQTNVDAAVKCYAEVERRYPTHDFEVLMSWKSAADLLWDAKRPDEAREFYRKIVGRFDKPDAPQVFQAVVRGSTRRLSGGALPGENR